MRPADPELASVIAEAVKEMVDEHGEEYVTLQLHTYEAERVFPGCHGALPESTAFPVISREISNLASERWLAVIRHRRATGHSDPNPHYAGQSSKHVQTVEVEDYTWTVTRTEYWNLHTVGQVPFGASRGGGPSWTAKSRTGVISRSTVSAKAAIRNGRRRMVKDV